MPITDYLRRNAAQFGDEVALVEVNPQIQEERRVTWRDYRLVEHTDPTPYRREITWKVFDEKATCCSAAASGAAPRWAYC